MDRVLELHHLMATPRQWRALGRAARLGYDFADWDWETLPIEELEGELERQEQYTEQRRVKALADAKALGYDFRQWDCFGLPIDELEGELKRGQEYARTEAQFAWMPFTTPTELAAVAERPNVLSQLTRTETVRLPDGTVTTKAYLKRRFADGKEETLESTQTTHEQMPTPAAKPVEAEQQSKRRGWLW